LLCRGVMEGEMDPGRPSPLKHARRFASITVVQSRRSMPHALRISPAARWRCGQSALRSRTLRARRPSPRERQAPESSRDVSDPTSGPLTLAPGSVRGSLTSRLLVVGVAAKAPTKCTRIDRENPLQMLAVGRPSQGPWSTDAHEHHFLRRSFRDRGSESPSVLCRLRIATAKHFPRTCIWRTKLEREACGVRLLQMACSSSTTRRAARRSVSKSPRLRP